MFDNPLSPLRLQNDAGHCAKNGDDTWTIVTDLLVNNNKTVVCDVRYNAKALYE